MKGMMFKEELFHAVVAGTKTETRRVVKLPWRYRYGWEGPYPPPETERMYPQVDGDWTPIGNAGQCNGCSVSVGPDAKPRYVPGEVVYLKEPWCQCLRGRCYRFEDRHRPCPRSIVCPHWRNKMFMPARAARYFIRITEVRCERLLEIDDDGARAEGIVDAGCSNCGESEPCGCDRPEPLPVDAFIYLWDSINKPPHDWNSNPWVWVYRFELCEKPD